MEIRHFGKPFAFRDFCISLAGYSCLECHQPRHLRFGGGGQRAPPGTVGGVACRCYRGWTRATLFGNFTVRYWKWHIDIVWLVVSNIFFHNIWDILSHWLSHFSRWGWNHQPVVDYPIKDGDFPVRYVSLTWGYGWRIPMFVGCRTVASKRDERGTWVQTNTVLVGGLEHFLFVHSVWNNNPNWLSYFSEGLKAPTRIKVLIQIITFKTKEETTHKLSKKHTLKLTWDMEPKTLGSKGRWKGIWNLPFQSYMVTGWQKLTCFWHLMVKITSV